jgi:hypothetical protein
VTLVREDARWAFVRPGPQLSGFVHSDELKRTGLLNRQVTGRTQVGGGSLGGNRSILKLAIRYATKRVVLLVLHASGPPCLSPGPRLSRAT